ncbi:hypothetical protein EDC18_101466 [Natranaerovirga pectinivora]|uniref:Cof subfamily protein (Haloacid dehalogenase superfamily)/HAD superfamily hydrolase (TIGR01484 family) n=1 Tax=Natranaerovirga pectinivora TaxID=682400 RepID=A0A4R3MSF7_9FIRM|nr:HAD family hydrolase [Natranaerovirga pectinivora]TCT17168.1 hypothetical protein EDC18_101466 [Natranaerovirga pectinivora]
MNTIILDLDGTFLRSDKTISQQNINTIKKLIDLNKDIIIATARPPRRVYNQLPCELHNNKIIFLNGAVIHHNGKPIFNKHIAVDDFTTIYNLVRKYPDKGVIAVEYDQLYAMGNFESHIPKVFYTEVDELEYKETPKILVKVLDDTFREELLYHLPPNCNIVFTDNGTLAHIMHQSVSKRNAVQYLFDTYGGHFKNTICFGDDYNDMELFKECKVSVAMKNAISELKEISTHITSSNDEDGVSEFINTYYSLI